MEWLIVIVVFLLCSPLLGSTKTANATVVERREDIEQPPQNPHDHSEHPQEMIRLYFVKFKFRNGKELEFPVSGHDYERVRLGDTGKLSYEGTHFLHFERTGGTS